MFPPFLAGGYGAKNKGKQAEQLAETVGRAVRGIVFEKRQFFARGTNTAITLTLDANIQRACEAIAAQNMSKGCIIVMQVGSGRILASTSMPEFDPDDIAASIRADDTSLINRSLSRANR